MNLTLLWAVLTLLSANGKEQYLVREDNVDIGFFTSYFDSKTWITYIDELLYETGDIKNMEVVLGHLLRHVASAEQWCRISDSYRRLYNHNLKNKLRTQRYNITQWIPCGVFISQKYISPIIQEDIITILVNAQLHINVTFMDISIDTNVLEPDYEFQIVNHTHEGNNFATSIRMTFTNTHSTIIVIR